MHTTGHSYGRDHKGTGVPFAEVFAPFYSRGEAIVTAADGLFRFGARVIRAIAVKARERATIDALSDLDDRTLKDIGVSRSDIRYIARRTAVDGTN